MNAEFFKALDELEAERKIKKEYMLEKISQALAAAYKKDRLDSCDNVFVDVNQTKKEIKMYTKRTVVQEVENPETEISLSDAALISKKYQLGDTVAEEIKMKDFGRIAAQTAKQVIIQGIREAERLMLEEEFSSKQNQLLTAVVLKTDNANGSAIVDIGANGEHTEALLPANEQVKGEKLHEGQHIKVYVVDIKPGRRGPQIFISRTHPGLVEKLFKLEVPEIQDGTVEIKSVAREAGSRTKIAVYSSNPEVRAVGACIGSNRTRITNICAELNGEKIDIVKFSENPEEYISAALSPADIISVTVTPGTKNCCAVVSDDQLSLAIGKEGQNARLAARLTGYKIDIKPLSQANL